MDISIHDIQSSWRCSWQQQLSENELLVDDCPFLHASSIAADTSKSPDPKKYDPGNSTKTRKQTEVQYEHLQMH